MDNSIMVSGILVGSKTIKGLSKDYIKSVRHELGLQHLLNWKRDGQN